VAPQIQPIAERLARYSERVVNGGCLIWLGKWDHRGYGQIHCRDLNGARRHQKTATVVWEREHGPRPEGLEIGHTCRNRACIELGHLRLQTRSENSLDRAPYLRKRAKCGHELVYMPGRKERGCPPCRVAYMAEWRAKQKQQ
jgi:hypothetical protein